jgi:hypothetical protein
LWWGSNSRSFFLPFFYSFSFKNSLVLEFLYLSDLLCLRAKLLLWFLSTGRRLRDAEIVSGEEKSADYGCEKEARSC